MNKIDVIISDITCMKERFCVAGWDLGECRMKRLLIDGSYWNAEDLSVIGKRYSWITVSSQSLSDQRDYPHRTEDVNIDVDSVKIKKVFQTGQEVAEQLRGSVSKSLMEIFCNHVIENSYVPQYSICPSLGAIELPAMYMLYS
jgi:hypothetical protein